MNRKDNIDSKDISEVLPLREDLDGTIDLNCDMGEGVGNDELIMPYISSANIACGFHAGDEESIWQTVELALKYKVAVGVHPSFFDKKNFGRTEINMSSEEIYEF